MSAFRARSALRLPAPIVLAAGVALWSLLAASPALARVEGGGGIEPGRAGPSGEPGSSLAVGLSILAILLVVSVVSAAVAWRRRRRRPAPVSVYDAIRDRLETDGAAVTR